MPYCSEDSDGFSHGSLDLDGLNVVPVLLQEGRQIVESHNNVLSDGLVIHGFVGYGLIQAGNLLELPVHGTLNIIDLFGKWLVVGTWFWEHTNLVEHWTEHDWDLLDEDISGEEEGVFLGPLLDKFLILVELLELIHGDNIDVDSVSLNLISVLLIGNQANLKVWSWDVWKSDGTGESLIFLWIIILKSNLELDSLGELSSLGAFSHFLDAIKNECVCDLTHI
jgi:hypothetical protein